MSKSVSTAHRFSCSLLSILALSTAAIRAQCATQWLPGLGLPGVNGNVNAMTTWDPDGAGPKLPVLVLGGAFRVAGTVATENIAVYDPASGAWSALGSGLDSTSLPWAGGQYNGMATGVPDQALVLSILGFAPISVPIPATLTAGVRNCDAIVSPDLLQLAQPIGGSAVWYGPCRRGHRPELGVPGSIYGLLGPGMAVHGAWEGRRVRQLSSVPGNVHSASGL